MEKVGYSDFFNMPIPAFLAVVDFENRKIKEEEKQAKKIKSGKGSRRR